MTYSMQGEVCFSYFLTPVVLQENERYFDLCFKHDGYCSERSPADFKTKEDFSKEQYRYLQSLLPLFDPKYQKGKSEYERSLAKMIKMLIFEVVHEKSWPLTKISLCRNLKLGFDVYPIEKYILSL
jgi:hypothetical protein